MPTRNSLLRICYSAQLATWLSSALTSTALESTVSRFMPMIQKWAARHCSMPTSTLSFARNCRQHRCSCFQPCRRRLLERSRVLSSAACRRLVTSTHTLWQAAAICSCHSASLSQYVWHHSWTSCLRLQPRITLSTFCSREAPTRLSRSCWRCRSLECIRSAVVTKETWLCLSHKLYLVSFVTNGAGVTLNFSAVRLTDRNWQPQQRV